MSVFLTPRFFLLLALLILGFTVAFFLPWLLGPMRILLGLLAVLTLLDAVLLYAPAKGQAAPVFGRRVLGDKLANGSDNDIRIYLENHYRFPIHTETIDEIPHQFQRRDVLFETSIKPGQTQIIQYQLRPTRRGEYEFGAMNIYAASPLGLLRRRFRYEQGRVVPVYPSFLQMRQYELLAIHNRLTEVGVKRIRRVGHSLEFEQIRPYVPGDDPRSINWQATARRAGTGAADALVVNHFQDERAQQVYCLIDKGRVMRMPFDGLSLLDYAINATLVVSNIALLKHDKAGLLTFSNRPGAALAADRRPGHLLVVPREEVDHWLDADDDLLAHLLRTSRTIATAQQAAFPTERVALLVVGLEVPHLHLHLVPVDGMGDVDFARARRDVPLEELEANAEAIKGRLP